MSYLTQNAIAVNRAMNARVAQAVASESPTGSADPWATNPDGWTLTYRRRWAAAPGWDAAWESALASDPEADPGENEAVITDAMILSQVQSMLGTERVNR